jgi:Protein-glutamine gamma-glutamyltransferase
MNLSELSTSHLVRQGGILLDSADPDRDEAQIQQWLADLGLRTGVVTQQLSGPSGIRIICQFSPSHRIQYLPLHDTLALHQRWHRKHAGRPLTLEQEILLALLAAPRAIEFADLPALQSHVRVRSHIVEAAKLTALAFKTHAAERPEAYWQYDEDHGFLLKPGCDLIEAIVAATQPEATGRLYDFSCYRATEYVILLGIALELQTHRPSLYRQLLSSCQVHAIRSGQFHDVFLTEYGTLHNPVPPRYYVPGDRLWFRNPDARSSDIQGYEGSWVIYMGQGLFSNFWERDKPFTLESKCLEIFHWRDGAQLNTEGTLDMDETRVAQAVQTSNGHPALFQAALEKMMRLRDPQGVYAEGGCIDATREFPRCVSAQSCQLVLPRFTP